MNKLYSTDQIVAYLEHYGYEYDPNTKEGLGGRLLGYKLNYRLPRFIKEEVLFTSRASDVLSIQGIEYNFLVWFESTFRRECIPPGRYIVLKEMRRGARKANSTMWLTNCGSLRGIRMRGMDEVEWWGCDPPSPKK